MPFQPVPNAALVTIRGTLAGERVTNNLGFSLTTPGVVSSAALATLANGVDDWWVANLCPTLPAEYIYQDVIARVLDVEDGPVAEDSINGGTVGSLAGAILPNNCSFCVSFKTGLGGVTNRGRNYVAGLLESEVTNSALNNTRAAALAAAYRTAIGPGSVANGWVWSHISRKELVPGGPGRAIPITQVTISDNVIDSQRRRLPGRGQ